MGRRRTNVEMTTMNFRVPVDFKERVVAAAYRKAKADDSTIVPSEVNLSAFIVRSLRAETEIRVTADGETFDQLVEQYRTARIEEAREDLNRLEFDL